VCVCVCVCVCGCVCECVCVCVCVCVWVCVCVCVCKYVLLAAGGYTRMTRVMNHWRGSGEPGVGKSPANAVMGRPRSCGTTR